jgi:hypothetical protein
VVFLADGRIVGDEAGLGVDDILDHLRDVPAGSTR